MSITYCLNIYPNAERIAFFEDGAIVSYIYFYLLSSQGFRLGSLSGFILGKPGVNFFSNLK